MKILHFIDSLGRGGAETLLAGIVKGLSSNEHLIVTLYTVNDFEEELQGHNIISLNCTNKISLLWAVVKLRKIIRQYQPDVVHSHLYWSNVVARLACPSSVKLFFSNHCVQSFASFKSKKLVLIERLTYFRKHTMISVSQEVEDDYKKFVRIKGKHFVLYNYVENSFFKTRQKAFDSSEGIRAVAVGRVAEQKNYDYLINNFPDKENISLSIFGKDTAEQTLQSLIASSRKKNIYYKGVSKKLSDEISEYDVFVMSSFYEGQPVSVLEAMASSLPVLLSDIPVMHEAAADAALYFDINNPDSLSLLLQKISDGRIDLNAYSEKCFRRASEIATKDKYLEKLISIYQEQ